MAELTALSEMMLLTFLGGLAAILAFKMLNGRINTRGLLKCKQEGGVSPVRVQLLLFTGVAAGSYLALVAEAVATGKPMLPEVPPEILAIIGGSQVVYLGRKSYLGVFKGLLAQLASGRK